MTLNGRRSLLKEELKELIESNKLLVCEMEDETSSNGSKPTPTNTPSMHFDEVSNFKVIVDFQQIWSTSLRYAIEPILTSQNEPPFPPQDRFFFVGSDGLARRGGRGFCGGGGTRVR